MIPTATGRERTRWHVVQKAAWAALRRASARLRLFTERGVAREEMTVRSEDTLCAAGASTTPQARYQRRMSSLLAGNSRTPMTSTRSGW
jgi:hypothetical protein